MQLNGSEEIPCLKVLFKMYQIDAYEYIYFLTILPVFWLAYFLVLRWKRKTQAKFATAELLNVLSPNRSKFKPGLKMIMLSLTFYGFRINEP